MSSERSPALSPCPWWPIVSAVKTTAAFCSFRAHDEVSHSALICHSVAYQGPYMHAFGSSQTHAVYSFLTLSSLSRNNTTLGLSLEIKSPQNDLLTLDQSSPVTHSQSVSKTVCHFYSAWLYVSTQICTVI